MKQKPPFHEKLSWRLDKRIRLPGGYRIGLENLASIIALLTTLVAITLMIGRLSGQRLISSGQEHIMDITGIVYTPRIINKRCVYLLSAPDISTEIPVHVLL